MTKIDLWNETLDKQKYLITAGTNRYGRQRYVIKYNDTADWDISTVPIPMTKKQALNLLNRIMKEYQERLNTRITFKYKYSNIEFNIIEYMDDIIN